MPPRYAYWTIIAGGLPTAFRATDRDELLPTFQRIKEKHPDAEMKWFARGKLWESREAAHAAGKRTRPGHAAPRDENRGSGERRGRDWRPGGDHRDPRQKFIDTKKQRNAAVRKQRWERKQVADDPNETSPPRPGREPRRKENPRPAPPPRPNEPVVIPPGPPEQGRPTSRRPFRRGGNFRKGPRR
jgi:hypothetical protein